MQFCHRALVGCVHKRILQFRLVNIHRDLYVIAPLITFGDGLREQFNVVQGLVHVSNDVGQQSNAPCLEER